MFKRSSSLHGLVVGGAAGAAQEGDWPSKGFRQSYMLQNSKHAKWKGQRSKVQRALIRTRRLSQTKQKVCVCVCVRVEAMLTERLFVKHIFNIFSKLWFELHNDTNLAQKNYER